MLYKYPDFSEGTYYTMKGIDKFNNYNWKKYLKKALSDWIGLKDKDDHNNGVQFMKFSGNKAWKN